MNIKKMVFGKRKVNSFIDLPAGTGTRSEFIVYKLTSRCSNSIQSEYTPYMYENQYNFLRDLNLQGEMSGSVFYRYFSWGSGLPTYNTDISFTGTLLIKSPRFQQDPITGQGVISPPLVTSNDIRFTVQQGRIIEAYKCN